MKLTKPRLKEIIEEVLDDEELGQVMKMINPIFSRVDKNRQVVDKNVNILQAKITDVAETGIERLKHFQRTGEVLDILFREPEGTGELGALPSDAGSDMRDPRDTRSLKPSAPDEEEDPDYMPSVRETGHRASKTTKFTETQLRQIVEEEFADYLKNKLEAKEKK